MDDEVEPFFTQLLVDGDVVMSVDGYVGTSYMKRIAKNKGCCLVTRKKSEPAFGSVK